MSYTAKLLNYVEPYYIDGIAKTALWTEVNTNVKPNDKVFIINGFYDSERFIRKGKWNKNADGYRVLVVDRCKVVLDIDWETGLFKGLTQTYRESDFDSFIKVHHIRNQREFDYINKIYIDSYTASRVSKFELNQTNHIIYSQVGWTGATGLGANSGIQTTKSFWARSGYNWINITNQLINNTFTFSSQYIAKGLTNNSRLFILGEDIAYSDILLKERNIYKWTGSASWVIDTEYKQPVLSKLYFKTGVFAGIHNDGLYGNYLRPLVWNGTPSVWNSGFFINSLWQSGTMKSKSSISEQSFYSTLENGLPVQTTDFSNNRGFGYNWALDSDFISGTIENGNIINSNIGQYDTGLTALNDYFGLTNSYNFELKGGFYNYCDIDNTKVSNSATLDSIVYNSYLENVRLYNSQLHESYFNDGQFSSSEKSIQITTADFSSYIISGTSATASSIRAILKLYISDEDITRLDNLDGFYLTKLNKEFLFSRLDSDLKIWLPIETKYILDTFYDFAANSVNGECLASIKTKFDNKYVPYVEFNGSVFRTLSVSNDKPFASIDIDLSAYFAFYKYNGQFYFINQTYLDKTNVDLAFRGNAITNSDFHDGVAKDIDWLGGSYVNYPSNVIKWENSDTNLKISKVANNQIKLILVATQSTINDDSFRKNRWVWIDSIVHLNPLGQRINITGAYQVATYSLGELTLYSDLVTGLSWSGTFSVLGGHRPKYLSVHKLLIQDSNVQNGLFIRNLFRNTTFENNLIDNNEANMNNENVSKLRVLNHYFINSASSSNTVKSGVFHNSHFVNVSWQSGIADNSIWLGPNFGGGVFNYGFWRDGTFSDGLFANSRGITTSSDDYFFETGYYRNWAKGTFNSGSFFNSVWLDGTFNSGRFLGSDWYGGLWNNGVLGDFSLPVSTTTMAKYLNIGTGATFTRWNYGIVQNAEVGGQGYIDWYDGQFEGGVFSASASTSTNRSTWYNGKFNAGNFAGMAKWKNGEFNSGRFTSYYGWTLSNSSQALDYSWENGEFKGGIFGLESGSTNSTWFNGEFYDGIFNGRVWNSGIFLGGKFEGSGTTSVIRNPASFSESFTQSYWGLWRNGYVVDQKHKADPSFVVPVNNSQYAEVAPVIEAKLNRMLWLNGTFNHPSGDIITSAWLSGKFKKGKFTAGVFNPYTRRDWWAPEFGTYSAFNLKFNDCIWEGGDFRDGHFYISDWLSGNFHSGSMSGARWFDGVWNYGNAMNIFWENGTWKNGNWDGSPFDLNTLNFTQSEHQMKSGMERDMLMRIANIHQTGKIHVINAFTGSLSDNYFHSWTYSQTSAELSDFTYATLSSDNYVFLDNAFTFSSIFFEVSKTFNVPNGFTTYIFEVGSVVDSFANYVLYISNDDYYGYISITSSSVDTQSTISNRFVNEINAGTTQPIVNTLQYTPNGYLTKKVTWDQLFIGLTAGYTIATYVSGGQFSIKLPIILRSNAVAEVLRAYSAVDLAYIPNLYKKSERLYALLNTTSGLTTSVLTQSGLLYNFSIDLESTLGRTDFLLSISNNTYTETLLDTSGIKTFNYSFITPQNLEGSASNIYLERILYEKPDNSKLSVFNNAKLNILSYQYDNTINNNLYTFATYSRPFRYGPTGSTLSLPGRLLQGVIANSEPVSIKYGNGAFKYGVWENGYWNNGWHASWSSENEYSLFTNLVVGGFIEVAPRLWDIKLTALTNTDGLEIGNKVSVGNLVFIDVNEKRRLVRTWFRVVDKTPKQITIRINTDFAVRRIERDSSNHLIYVSKNIWQSGIFHNGYFKGVWNYGLFRGYPMLTKMVESQWIDGIFDGGVFKSTKSYYLSQGISQSYNNGLIQNFVFRDNNVATFSGAFKYNSWIDTNYFTSSMTNLFKDNLRYDSNWGVVMSSGNLRGYPTEDVLSSSSIFKNSYDLNSKFYSLGMKWTNYVDYTGSSAYFTYPFNTSGIPGVSRFLEAGWTYTANFLDMHSNSKGIAISGLTDEGVLQVNYQKESYSGIGVKFAQVSKIQYSNGDRHIVRAETPDGFGVIPGDFSSNNNNGTKNYTIKIDSVTQGTGKKFSNMSYNYASWPLRPAVSGIPKLSSDAGFLVVSYANISSSGIPQPSLSSLGDTYLNLRRVYMLDLFNPTQSDTQFGGYNRSGATANSIGMSNPVTSNVGGSTWNYINYQATSNTRLKFNAFIPFKFFATELDTKGFWDDRSERRSGWSIFKIIGIIERKPVTKGTPDETNWEHFVSTELNFYPNSAFSSGISGYCIDKTNCTIAFDNTNQQVSANYFKGYLQIDGVEKQVEKGDLFRFRLYWVDVRKMFASITSNPDKQGPPGFMDLVIGKDTDLPYTEPNNGYWEIQDMTTYVNQNTNFLDNIKANNIEKFRYSVVDFDLATVPEIKFQGTSSIGTDALPNIFLLNDDYPNLPGSASTVNHGFTTGNKKEYFYNRKSLNLFFKSVEAFSVQFAKIQFYETDMIPFFRYTDEYAVNNDAQTPYYGDALRDKIAEGTLSLDTASFTSPFSGVIPIRGAVLLPPPPSGGGGVGGGTNTFTINYEFRNGSLSGVNEFTSYYRIKELTSSNVFVKQVEADHLSNTSTSGQFTITESNKVEIFVIATYSGPPLSNQSIITINLPYSIESSSPGTTSTLTKTFTPTTSFNLVVEAQRYILYEYTNVGFGLSTESACNTAIHTVYADDNPIQIGTIIYITRTPITVLTGATHIFIAGNWYINSTTGAITGVDPLSC